MYEKQGPKEPTWLTCFLILIIKYRQAIFVPLYVVCVSVEDPVVPVVKRVGGGGERSRLLSYVGDERSVENFMRSYYINKQNI